MSLDPTILEQIADHLADAGRDHLDDTGRALLRQRLDTATAGADGETARQVARLSALVETLHPHAGRPGLMAALRADPEGWTALRRDSAAADEAERIRVRDLARQVVASERLDHTPPPIPHTLDDFIQDHADEQTAWLIRGLWPAGGRVLFTAPAKGGKTTTVSNLVRSLADDAPFLGAYPVEGTTEDTTRARVILLDTEMTEGQLARWLAVAGIAHPEAVEVVSLRGRVHTFDPTDPTNRARWAHALADAEAVILDPVGPVLAAHGLDENDNTDVGRFLTGWDALMHEARVPSSLIVHHHGHNGERARGSSKFLDSADALWTLVRDGDTTDAPRYFRATGRDVDVPETALTYDPASRALTAAGGNRRDVAGMDVLPDLVALLELHGEPMSRNQIELAMKNNHGHARGDVRSAMSLAVRTDGPCMEVPGKHGAKRLTLRPHNLAGEVPESGGPVARSDPSTSPPTPGEV